MSRNHTSLLVLVLLALLGAGAAPLRGEVRVQYLIDTNAEDSDGDGDPYNDNILVHLTAGDGFTTMADGYPQYCFGFGVRTEPTADPTDEDLAGTDTIMMGMLNATFPAPTLAFREGQKVYLTLTNVGMMMRPDLFDPHSVHFHGFPNAAAVFDGVPDASLTVNMMSSFTYFYDIREPGTFMYHCHVEATEHMQMGMLGNCWVYPKQDQVAPGTFLGDHEHQLGDRYAYNDGDGSTRYDVEYPVQLTAFDPAFHDASISVQPLPFALMDDRYPLINGRGYPDTLEAVGPANPMGGATSQRVATKIEATVGQRILLRVSSLTTTRNFTLTSMGIPMRVVGQGARLLRGPSGKDLSYRTTSVTVGGGEAKDVILDTDGLSPGTYLLYTANLQYLCNDKEDFGGMMTEITLTAAP